MEEIKDGIWDSQDSGSTAMMRLKERMKSVSDTLFTYYNTTGTVIFCCTPVL